MKKKARRKFILDYMIEEGLLNRSKKFTHWYSLEFGSIDLKVLEGLHIEVSGTAVESPLRDAISFSYDKRARGFAIEKVEKDGKRTIIPWIKNEDYLRKFGHAYSKKIAEEFNKNRAVINEVKDFFTKEPPTAEEIIMREKIMTFKNLFMRGKDCAELGEYEIDSSGFYLFHNLDVENSTSYGLSMNTKIVDLSYDLDFRIEKKGEPLTIDPTRYYQFLHSKLSTILDFCLELMLKIDWKHGYDFKGNPRDGKREDYAMIDIENGVIIGQSRDSQSGFVPCYDLFKGDLHILSLSDGVDEDFITQEAVSYLEFMINKMTTVSTKGMVI